MKRLLIFATLLTSVLALTACAAATVEPITPTAAPSDTPLPPTSSPAPTVTPTRTPFPTWPPPSPSPDFMDTRIVNGYGYLLAPSADPDCQLPCWQGLRIGESTKEDVVRMFDEVLDIRDGLRISTHQSIIPVPGTEAIWYPWDFEDTELDIPANLTVLTIVDEETGILQGISIDTSPFTLFEVHTTQQIIRELGAPSAIYAHYSGSIVNLDLLYYEGIVISSATEMLAEEQVVGDETKLVNAYCLDEIPLISNSYIVEPFTDIDEDSLTPLQNVWFGEYLRSGFSHSVEKEFDLTAEEFVEIALDDDNPCIMLERALTG